MLIDEWVACRWCGHNLGSMRVWRQRRTGCCCSCGELLGIPVTSITRIVPPPTKDGDNCNTDNTNSSSHSPTNDSCVPLFP